MTETVVEKKEWIKIPSKTGIWKAEEIGEELVGKYIRRESSSFQNRPNCKYTLESDNPVNVGGLVSFYGTEGLNNDMSDIPIGYNVKIIYRGEKPTKDPKKKAFKLFDVFAWMNKSDALFKKLYPKVENQNGNDKNKSKAASLAESDDPDALNEINHNIEIYKSNNYGSKPTAKKLAFMVESDPDMKGKPNEKKRYLKQIGLMVERGELQEG